MSDFTPIIPGPFGFTSTASATITGGQLLEVTGDNTVGPAAAGSQKVVGQAAHDAASGARLTVHGRGPITTATAAATTTAGNPLKAAASGQVTPLTVDTDNDLLRVGVALAGAAAAATVRYMQF